MKFHLSIAMLLISICSTGQGNVASRTLINGSPSFEGAFLFFPLTGDSIELDNPDLQSKLEKSRDKKIFYCIYNEGKSRIYDLDSVLAGLAVIDFKIPDPLFYQDLYKAKICPICHGNKNVIPFIYGKPVSSIMRKAEKGEVKLGGCSFSSTSPLFYCKKDKLEF